MLNICPTPKDIEQLIVDFQTKFDGQHTADPENCFPCKMREALATSTGLRDLCIEGAVDLLMRKGPTTIQQVLAISFICGQMWQAKLSQTATEPQAHISTAKDEIVWLEELLKKSLDKEENLW